MRNVIFFKIILLSLFFIAFSCNDEVFDVLAAQEKLCGVWNCSEGEENYQIQIVANGVNSVNIQNLCQMGNKVNVNAKIMSATSLLIASQDAFFIDGEDERETQYALEGFGVISEEFTKIVFNNLGFREGDEKMTSRKITCIKRN